MTPDDRLSALFAADLPPASDPAFDAEVMASMARRRFVRDLLGLGGAFVVATAVLAMVWPALQPVAVLLTRPLAPMGLALAGVLAIAFLAAGLPAPAAGREIMTKIS